MKVRNFAEKLGARERERELLDGLCEGFLVRRGRRSGDWCLEFWILSVGYYKEERTNPRDPLRRVGGFHSTRRKRGHSKELQVDNVEWLIERFLHGWIRPGGDFAGKKGGGTGDFVEPVTEGCCCATVLAVCTRASGWTRERGRGRGQIQRRLTGPAVD